ncbi:MAG: hypothetical protein IPK66_10620 [Rhodospirillales bacterium]|nr:hypothetical protein [Rhodospirillales bacterium]
MAVLAGTFAAMSAPGGTSPARAAEVPLEFPEGGPITPTDTALSDWAIDQRIAYIEQRLDDNRLHGQVWYWSWMTINGGSAAILGIQAGLSNHKDDRINNGVQAGLGAIGVADLLLRPLEARHGADPISDLPDSSRQEKIVKLRAAETQLHRNADRADERYAVVQHAGNVGVNAAAGLIIGLAGKRSDGIIAFVTGVIGGEIQIWSQPWEPADDWQSYKQQYAGQVDRSRLTAFLVPIADGGAEAGLRWTW